MTDVSVILRPPYLSRGTATWRLHEKKKMLHNSSGMKNRTGQILSEVVHKAIIYHISDS